MNKTTRWLLFLVAFVAIAVAIILWRQRQAPPPLPQAQSQAEPPTEAPPAPPPTAVAEPQIRYPIEEAQRQLGEDVSLGSDREAKPLPALDESDAAMRDALVGLYGGESLERFFYLNDIVRHVVATIDNVPGKQVAQRLMPVKPPAGQFLTTGKEGNVYLSPANYARYTPFVRLAQGVNPKTVVAVYIRLYPLFQQAYRELGYPTGYFNDRLVEVIDHLLAAPDVEGPVKLVQPRVLYQFEDPKLEALSAGEKTLIRMGSENAGKVKETLREVRQALTAGIPEGAGRTQ